MELIFLRPFSLKRQPARNPPSINNNAMRAKGRTMSDGYLEHVNVTVKNLDDTAEFLLAAMPNWRIRARSKMHWFGSEVDWLHIGTPSSYIALQSGGEGSGLNWKESQVGVKHIGLVVPSLSTVIERLAAAGYCVDHLGASHPHRKSAYFIEADNLQFEFIEYLSTAIEERNDYTR
ncbi:VOC family protein [Paucibacter sp. B2R-40]|uniref:VOC family protein n=1 Tax=Paucibacter sp. B2R-40 TaxID=2893554 RepID=UPI0021E416B4|nr:VOC family protein [Paucibacter sp. B2R-40]MCV2353820.1 VOC family protein [Paucibacter sp. B2R-40]